MQTDVPSYQTPNNETGYDLECLKQYAQYLVDTVNSQVSLLPDYNIQLVYVDEDVPETMFAQYLSDYANMSEASLKTDFKAPLFFGPAMVCDSDDRDISLRSLHPICDKYNYHGLHAQICTRRGEYGYANLFPRHSIDQPVEAMAVALAKFLLVMNWTRVGLVADTTVKFGVASSYNTLVIGALSKVAIQIAHVEAGFDFDVMFSKIMQRGLARIIIIIPSYEYNCRDCLNVWCSAAKTGIRSPKNVLVFVTATCSKCLHMIPYWSSIFASFPASNITYCDNTLPLDQINLSMFIDNDMLLKDPAKKPPFSTAMARFLAEKDDSKKPPLQMKSCTFTRPMFFFCSAFWATILLLNKTETAIKQRYDVTFTNIAATLPNAAVILRDAIVETATNFGQLYGTDAEPFYRMSREFVVLKQVQKKNETSALITLMSWITNIFEGQRVTQNISNATLLYLLNQGYWNTTSDGSAPKDRAKLEHIDGGVHFSLFLGVCATGSVMAIAHFVLFLITFRQFKKRDQTQRLMKTSDFFNYELNLFLLGACILIDLSSIHLIIGAAFFPGSSCLFQPLLVTISTSAVNIVIFLRMTTLHSFAYNHRYISSGIRDLINFDRLLFEQGQVQDLYTSTRHTLKMAVRATAVVFVVTFTWLAATEPVVQKKVFYQDNPFYSYTMDTEYDVYVVKCESQSRVNLITVSIIVNAFVLLFGCYKSVVERKFVKRTRRRFRTEPKRLCLVPICSITIWAGISLVYVLVMSQPPELAYLQVVTVSVGLLCNSFTLVAIFFFRQHTYLIGGE